MFSNRYLSHNSISYRISRYRFILLVKFPITFGPLLLKLFDSQSPNYIVTRLKYKLYNNQLH